MVRVQLYLPPDLYKSIKLKAKQKRMSFAGYVRVHLENELFSKEREKSLYQKFPFMKYAGMFKLGANASNNEAIDQALYCN